MPLSRGAKLGPYEIVQILGEGGMGSVYKALDTRLKRFVAIKVLRAGAVADPERRRRFVQEAQAASALNHPDIITIYDIGEQDGLDYIAMEYVAGKTLDALIPRKGMRLNELLGIAVQIAAGLERAHAAGIVHRDLKPGNVMVGEDGQVKVLDFGLAKLTERAAVAGEILTETVKPETKEGTIVGTASYMSPEQGEGRPVDARSDIFSFGSVLYEMVTGERAFKGESAMSTLAAILRGEPKPVSALNPDVPLDLDKLIHRCLRKDPARRFQDMADLHVALLELKEESDSGVLAADRSQPARRRRPRLAWLGAIALLLAGSVALWTRLRPSSAAPPFRATLLTSEQGGQFDPALSPDGKQVAFSWDVGGAGESLYVKLVDAGAPVRITNQPDVLDMSPAWSPDGRYIAFCETSANGSEIRIVPALGGQEKRVAPVRDCNDLVMGHLGSSGLSWSPNGQFLAVPDETGPNAHGIFLVSVENGTKTEVAKPDSKYVSDARPKFSPDGKHLLFLRGAELYVVALAVNGTPEGNPRRIVGTAQQPSIIDADWTPDGRRIVFCSGDYFWGPMWTVSAAGGQPAPVPEAGDRAGRVTASHAGNRLVYARISYEQNLWRMPGPLSQERGGREEPLVPSTERDSEPQYSPDGKRVAFVSTRSGSGEIWVCDAEGRNATQLTNFGRSLVGSPRWSPDGDSLAFDSNLSGNSAIYVVSVDGGKPRRFTTGPSDDVRPSWSHDGRWIYFSSDRGGDSQIWKAPVGGGPALRITHNRGEEAFESLDGKYLYWAKRTQPGIWRMPAGGGEETRVVEAGGLNGFAVAPAGIVFLDSDAIGRQRLKFVDERTLRVRTLYEFPKGIRLDPFSTALSVSPDGRWIVYARADLLGSNLMLIDGFR